MLYVPVGRFGTKVATPLESSRAEPTIAEPFLNVTVPVGTGREPALPIALFRTAATRITCGVVSSGGRCAQIGDRGDGSHHEAEGAAARLVVRVSAVGCRDSVRTRPPASR